MMRAALSSFSLLRCRFFSNDVRRAVDERAGVQIRSVPAELKSSYDAKCVHEEEEEEEEEEVCRQFAFKRRRRKEEEERKMKTKTKKERDAR